MTQNKLKPSEPDLYASAWASLEQESKRANPEELRKQGWKCIPDLIELTGRPKKTLHDMLWRKVAAGEYEVMTANVYGVRGNRKLNFYRPLLDNSLITP